ncbi:MAG: hypothetical protein ACRDQF_09765 [Thermocrispum sp.]
MAAPARTHHVGPYTDDVSALVLDQAAEALARLRTAYWLGDAGYTLHALACLQRQIRDRLPDAVADARDQDYSWAEIGDLLGLTRAAAWNRYGRPGRQGHPAPPEPD